jgi:hypothetical protein
MRIQTATLALVAALASVSAEPVSTGNAVKTPAEIAASETALDNLLSERESLQAFNATVDAARKAGVSEQAILEARFLYHVDRREDEAIAAMLPDFLKQRENFKLQDSAIFAVKEDWLAVIEYVQAIAALESGDKDAFKKHITEAFWLGPRQAAAFAPHIERLRLEEAMRAVTIDFNLALAPLDGGAPVVLGSLMDGRKALLLHFWSPRSRECEASLPDFSSTAAMLAANGIAVASLLPADTPEILTGARAMVLPYAGKPCGAWLVDSSDKPIGRDLRVQNLPTVVIVSTEGKILFNGDPTDEQFWDALKKIDARIARPKSEGDYEQ